MHFSFACWWPLRPTQSSHVTRQLQYARRDRERTDQSQINRRKCKAWQRPTNIQFRIACYLCGKHQLPSLSPTRDQTSGVACTIRTAQCTFTSEVSAREFRGLLRIVVDLVLRWFGHADAGCDPR